MKGPPSKAQIRAELDQQVEQFLNKGGCVNEVPRGISGRHDNSNTFGQIAQPGPKQSRTLLNEVVKTLDSRKHPEPNKKKRRPKKVLITDDFGEPLRWVWEDE